MNTETTSTSNEGASKIFDKVKWLCVWGLVAVGILGNWYFEEISVLLRAVAIVGVALVAAFILFQTETGRTIWHQGKGARAEVRRVIWPTRQQTTQTTMIVIALILIVSLILWGLDSLLAWGVSSTIG